MKTLPELKDLVDASRQFIDDKISIIELNGYASDAWGLSKVLGFDLKIQELLSEYYQLIDRAWNEHNRHTQNFTEQDLKDWITSVFLDDADTAYQRFKLNQSPKQQ